MTNSSWVIREKSTGKVLFETWNAKLIKALNTKKYEAVPILKYLVDLNKKIKKDEIEKMKRNPKRRSKRNPRKKLRAVSFLVRSEAKYKEESPPRIIAADKKAPAALRKATGYWARYRGYGYDLNTETAHHFWRRRDQPLPPGYRRRKNNLRRRSKRNPRRRNSSPAQIAYRKLVAKYGVKGAARHWKKR